MTLLLPKGTISAADAAYAAAIPQVIADRRPVGDLDIRGLKLRGQTISASLAGLISSANIDLSIDTASTLTLEVYDTKRKLIKSGVLHRGASLGINGQKFALVRPEKVGDTFNLVFEDWAVWLLRQQKSPLKAKRTKEMTRAKFIELMIREIKSPRLKLYAPERDVVQPLAQVEVAAGGSVQAYEFSRGSADGGSGEEENSWSAMRRLADEVQWRVFVVGNVVYLATDQRLIDESTRFKISEGSDGVDRIDWTLDENLKVSDATVSCQAQRWAAPVGTTVALVGQGPANGLWIVSGVSRTFGTASANVRLTRPREPLPEPATASAPETGGAGAPALADAPAAVNACYAEAERIHAMQQPYLWGGYGPTRFDCSGGVSKVLNAGGLLSGRLTTSGLISWGAPGEGQYLTVWVKETGNPRESHTFITFNGYPNRTWEAGGGGGATGWRPGGRSHSNFQPRHYPGT